MIPYSSIKKFLGVIFISQLSLFSSANAESLWEPWSSMDFESGLDSVNRDSNARNSTRGQSSSIQWEEVSAKNSLGYSIIWEQITDEELRSNLLLVENLGNKKIFKRPESFEEANLLYKNIKPSKDDYTFPLRLSPAFPSTNLLKDGETELKVYTLSSFSGGAAEGSGNQNYAFRFDYGLSNSLQFSGFYSTADDPLYSKINSHTSVNTPNYWESYGASIKFPLINKGNLRIAIEGSLESWNVRSGGPNIFNNSGGLVATKNFIGSISSPISWDIKDNFQLNLISGISFLPENQGAGQGGEGEFYGNNIFAGAGVIWSPITNLRFLSSALIPFGPGNNTFDSNLSYSRQPIFNIGINWDINPRIGLEGRLTNAFGATPSTGILTLPSTNRLGYYAGVKYTPFALDSPQGELTSRENSLSKGGITVNTALIPPDGTTQVWGNIDGSGNIFGYIGQSLSNTFQLDIVNLGRFRDIPDRGGKRGTLVRNYANNDGIKARVGGKFVFFSPLRGAPLWVSGRVSVGRSNGLQSGQGYTFSELISTWEATKWLAININPKLAWSGFSTAKGLGIGANIKLLNNLQLIPEYNLVDQKNGDNNGTLGLRWMFNEDINLDLYMSSAAGLQDIGQLLSADETRLGARFNMTY